MAVRKPLHRTRLHLGASEAATQRGEGWSFAGALDHGCRDHVRGSMAVRKPLHRARLQLGASEAATHEGKGGLLQAPSTMDVVSYVRSCGRDRVV